MNDTDPRLGTTLAGYEIEALLGRGGMGVVYLANDPRLGRKVALKVLAPQYAEDDAFRGRFVRESQMAAATDHPNIIPVYDAGEADGVLYLAMRYVDGTDLRELIREQGQLDMERAVTIVDQIGSALDAAHARGLVHRDVKPANVLMSSGAGRGKDHVYLTDFGLTKHTGSVSRMTATGTFMGTIDYMAPEQIEGKDLDHRADLYALACLFYECLVGNVPFQKDSDVAVMYAHMMDERPLASDARSDIPRAVAEVIAKCMSRDREERHDSAEEMISEVRTALGTSAPSEPAAKRSPTSVKPERRKVSRRSILGLAAIALVATVGAFFLTRGETPRTPPSSTPEASVWQPEASDTLQLQLSGAIDTSYEADVYDVDLFDTSPDVVDELHSQDVKVVCHVRAGAWEKGRPDATGYPDEILGASLDGSKSERWIDVRQLDVLRPLIADRLDICVEKGFDGVEFDDVDAYANDSGFPLTSDHQLAFNRMLSDLAHDRGLAAGLKNAPELAGDLEPDYEFAVNTGCYQFEECSLYETFAAAGKPVFVIEFELKPADFCSQAEQDGYIAQLKRYEAGAWRQACWEER